MTLSTPPKGAGPFYIWFDTLYEDGVCMGFDFYDNCEFYLFEVFSNTFFICFYTFGVVDSSGFKIYLRVVGIFEGVCWDYYILF